MKSGEVERQKEPGQSLGLKSSRLIVKQHVVMATAKWLENDRVGEVEEERRRKGDEGDTSG